jgi:Spy/CpxP family protein refolding chaperone
MSNHRQIKLLGIALATALALASAAAAAQHQGRRGGRGFRGEGTGPGGPMGPLAMLRGLDLSDDQRQRIRALFEEMEATGVPERLRKTRESLHEAIESGADEATLRQQASELGEVEGDAAVEWARVRSRIQEILTAEQKQELEQLKQDAEERRELRRKQREERRARRAKDPADLL